MHFFMRRAQIDPLHEMQNLVAGRKIRPTCFFHTSDNLVQTQSGTPPQASLSANDREDFLF
jgi:hypothetical protein